MAMKAFTCLLFVVLAITCTASARILDEELPPPAVAPTTSDSPSVSIPPVAAAPIGTSLTVAPVGIPGPGVTGSNVNPTTATTATVANADPHHLSFYMHGILGGSNPSSKTVTGIMTNPFANDQLPLAKPNGPVLPVNNDIPLNNDNHNVSFLTDIGKRTNTPVQKLMFGTLGVIDNVLTEGQELGSGLVGKAQGFYVVLSGDGSSHTMAFTVMFESRNYVDSINFFGVHHTAVSESQIGILGGTGKYVNANGYATMKTISSDQHNTDVVETLLEFTVYLS